MKRLLFFLLVGANLIVALILTFNAALCAFGCKGGPTFDDWEEFDEDRC